LAADAASHGPRKRPDGLPGSAVSRTEPRLRDRMFHVKRPNDGGPPLPTARLRRPCHRRTRRRRPAVHVRSPRPQRPALPGSSRPPCGPGKPSVPGPSDDCPCAWLVHSRSPTPGCPLPSHAPPDVPRETSPNRGAPATDRRTAERRDCAPCRRSPAIQQISASEAGTDTVAELHSGCRQRNLGRPQAVPPRPQPIRRTAPNDRI
jgi:hypothetical protein